MRRSRVDETEMDALLEALDIEAKLHSVYERRWDLPCGDPFDIWTCPYGKYTLAEVRNLKKVA